MKLLWWIVCLWCGHDWKNRPESYDDVFCYWSSECRCCGKVKAGSWKYYNGEGRT